MRQCPSRVECSASGCLGGPPNSRSNRRLVMVRPVVIEVAHVESEGAIGLDVNKMRFNEVYVTGFPIGRQTHEFVFT